MKKILSVLLVLALLIPCFAMADDLPVVKIGVFEPASGDSGAGGKQETLGMQYANQETPTVVIGDTESAYTHSCATDSISARHRITDRADLNFLIILISPLLIYCYQTIDDFKLYILLVNVIYIVIIADK